MKNYFLIFLSLILFTSNAQSITVLEFCKQNPEHKRVQLINKVFAQTKPQFFLAYLWKWLITGEYTFMPNDFKRHYLSLAAKDIGQELGWDQNKIDVEVEALFTELNRIANQ